MADFSKALFRIISGKHIDEDELSDFPQKEREILNECENVALPRGYLRNIMLDIADQISSEEVEKRIDILAKDFHDICDIESKNFKLDVERVNMKNLLLECMEEVHAPAEEKGVSLHARLDSQPLRVYADPERIKRVIAILLRNALKFTRKGGHVNVLAKGLPQEVIVSIIDDGVGIDARRQTKVFSRYFISSGQPLCLKGSGIGLNLVKLLVGEHGGKVWTESSPNHGSNFSFCIPREMLCEYEKPRKISSLFS